MNLRRLAYYLLPPLIYDTARKRRNISPQFNSYEEAAATCSGYDDPDIAAAIAHHTRLLCGRLNAPVPRFTAGEIKTVWAAREAICGGVLDVIDFGGACGCHYYAVRAALPDAVIDWHVIETDAMTTAGTRLAAERHATHELHFHETWESAREDCPAPDLVHSSSAIICTARPLDSLEEHIACGARYMLFTRIGLTEDVPLYAVQARPLSKGVKALPDGMRDRMVRYPLTWPPCRFFMRTLERAYRIVAEMEEENPIFTVGEEKIAGWGCLARRKE